MSDLNYIEISPLKKGIKLFGELARDERDFDIYKFVVADNLLAIELIEKIKGDLPCRFLPTNQSGLLRHCFFVQSANESAGIILHLRFHAVITGLSDTKTFDTYCYSSNALYRTMRAFWNPISHGSTKTSRKILYDLRPIRDSKKGARDPKLEIHPAYPWSLWPDIRGRLTIWDRPYLKLTSKRDKGLEAIEREMWALDNFFGIVAGQFDTSSSATLLSRSRDKTVRHPQISLYRAWKTPAPELLYGGPLLRIEKPEEFFRVTRNFLSWFESFENIVSLYRLSKFMEYKELSLLYNLFLIDTLFDKGALATPKPDTTLNDHQFKASKSDVLKAIASQIKDKQQRDFWLGRVGGISNGHGFRKRLDTLLDRIAPLVNIPPRVREDAAKFRGSFAHGDVLPKGISEKKAFYLGIIFEHAVDCIIFKELGISDESIHNSPNFQFKRHNVGLTLHEYNSVS